MSGRPERSCDIVMKGGITSGVVYPRAVTELARSFALKSVGGTSAGAIAAAAAAAAESARVRNLNAAGYDEVAALPEILSRKNRSGHTNLFTFFQPQSGTSRLFRVLSAALNAPSGVRGTIRVALAAGGEYWLAALLGVMPGALLGLIAWYSPLTALSVLSLITGVFLALLGATAAVVWKLFREFGREVPDNFFGLCSGMNGEVTPAKRDGSPTGNSDEPVALTIWLTAFLNRAAGLAGQQVPLTFGQLWNPLLPPGAEPAVTDIEVRLEMMTTCLTWGRPFRLPFRNDKDVRENRFYFRESEFRQLFPPNVVDWLCAHPRESRLADHWRKEGFVPMPEPWNLPVVVATRMSLSFPILLSTVPLYSYEPNMPAEDRERQRPRRCLFSDGGICSNFPMHFFDSPLPRWPTFGFNLVAKPDNMPAAEMEAGWMPANNNEGLSETWNDFGTRGGLRSVMGFVGAIVTTMQNWTDNSQARMPGYRDRIAHVPLKPHEGGLNLAMPEELIADLGDRGQKTGQKFVHRFATNNEPVMNWDNHRWIRLRSLLANVEGMVGALERTLAHQEAAAATAGQSYEDWIRSKPLREGTGYPLTTVAQRELALETIRQLRELAKTLADPVTSLEERAPRPRPELRPRPRI